ncbi:MAG: hypothetical protein QE271_06660, partial [Bacteriovoracaceae bacterium]|nr:hypothetical protein [Bacteriovoracaceae bacterium]
MQLQFKKRPCLFLSLSLFLHAVIVFALLFYQVGKIKSHKNLSATNLKKPKDFEVTYLTESKVDTSNIKQIVNSEVANKIKTDAPKYLSQFDNKTDRETIAKNVDVFYRGDKAQSTNVSKKTQKNKDSPKEKKEKINLANLGLGVEQLARIEIAKNIIKNSESEGGDVKRASSNNDYIKNAQLGDITNLNTAEYKFYGFYARIRGQL